jgi:hypothetical protein
MTLFLQNDTGDAGTGGVFPDRGFVDLIQIANGDTGLGEEAAAGDLIDVTYARSLGGIPPERLDELVNTDFFGHDIIVIPVDESFMLSPDLVGSVAELGGLTNPEAITNYGGITIAPGDTGNPTASVWVIYDTSDNGGQGYCVPKEGGGTVGMPSAVILYHELSHALRDATDTQLDDSDTGCEANPEEHQAELDENDMRDQLGSDHRDVTKHCTSPGCAANCCIVASVATGSAYSGEVNALRRVRDEALRRSEVGFDFFEHLHYDYYSVSPQVVAMMEGDQELRERIAAALVVPLTQCLKLLCFHRDAQPGAAGLGERFLEQLADCPELHSLSPEQVALALDTVRRPGAATPALPGALEPLARLLRARASASSFIRWGILDPIEMYLAAVGWRPDDIGSNEIGARLAAAFAHWGVRLPLTDVWQRLSNHTIAEELRFLCGWLLPTSQARADFARRLREHLGDHRADGAAIDAILGCETVGGRSA